MRVLVIWVEWEMLGFCFEVDFRIFRVCGWWLGIVSMWVFKGLERVSDEGSGVSVFSWSFFLKEAERLDSFREILFFWFGLRDRGREDSKLDFFDDWVIFVRRSFFFLGGSFFVGSWASVWLRWGYWNFFVFSGFLGGGLGFVFSRSGFSVIRILGI